MKSVLLALLSCALLTPLAGAAEPELMAALSVMGYGYKVKVTVNGADVGVEGGKSENRRLFNKDHEMAAQATPAIRARNFVLQPGANDIAIEYTKLDPKSADTLEIGLAMQGYPLPVLSVVSKTKTADKLSLKVNLAAKPAQDFKPVAISQ